MVDLPRRSEAILVSTAAQQQFPTLFPGHVSQPVPGRPIEQRAQAVLKSDRGNAIDCGLGEQWVLCIDVYAPAGIERRQQFAPLLR